MKPSSIVLLSGGLDSTTSLAIARELSEVKLCLSFFYGQRHDKELRAARRIADHYQIPWTLVQLSSIRRFLTKETALVKGGLEVPVDRSNEEIASGIPPTYVPGRNTILLAIAQSIAEAQDVDRIYVGFNYIDYSGYSDCRPEFVSRWNTLAEKATKRGVEGNSIKVIAPIIGLSKVQILQKALDLKAPIRLAWSCYTGKRFACGRCDSCKIRLAAFNELGLKDPCQYAIQI